MGYLRLCGC